MIIFSAESIDKIRSNQITDIILQEVSTQVYLPNPNAEPDHKKLFDLTDTEFNALKTIDTENRQFLLKKHSETIIARLNLNYLTEIMVLSATERSIEKMNEAVNNLGNKSLTELLEKFYFLMHNE